MKICLYKRYFCSESSEIEHKIRFVKSLISRLRNLESKTWDCQRLKIVWLHWTQQPHLACLAWSRLQLSDSDFVWGLMESEELSGEIVIIIPSLSTSSSRDIIGSWHKIFNRYLRWVLSFTEENICEAPTEDHLTGLEHYWGSL